jgi:hypothetical protein
MPRWSKLDINHKTCALREQIKNTIPKTCDACDIKPACARRVTVGWEVYDTLDHDSYQKEEHRWCSATKSMLAAAHSGIRKRSTHCIRVFIAHRDPVLVYSMVGWQPPDIEQPEILLHIEAMGNLCDVHRTYLEIVRAVQTGSWRNV